jgi:hypothetical protein
MYPPYLSDVNVALRLLVRIIALGPETLTNKHRQAHDVTCWDAGGEHLQCIVSHPIIRLPCYLGDLLWLNVFLRSVLVSLFLVQLLSGY